MAVITTNNLRKHVNAVRHLKGDFAEIGVFRADTFKRLAPLAKQQHKVAHGFDSFEGMDDPTDLDHGYYERGRLSCGGVDKFVDIMDAANVPHDTYELYPGFIPDCFHKITNDQQYSFALVDVDQYQPTVTSLPWVWDKLVVGGILVLDDYFKNREGLAAKAIDEWLATIHPLDYVFLEYTDTQLVIKKQFIPDNMLPKK